MQRNSIVFDLLLFVISVLGGLFFGQFLAFLILLPFHGMDLNIVLQKMASPLDYPELKMQLLLTQGISSFVAFVLAPIFFVYVRGERMWAILYKEPAMHVQLMVMTVLWMLVSLPFLSLVIEWNESVQLPEALQHWQVAAREKEDFLKKVTELLTDLNNPFELLIGLVVIAFLPALGEELVFRGYLQNKCRQLFGSGHVAIWFCAFLFSAIHFQFFGFVPRMLLGAMFGYLYYYTGQFHLAVLAHFLNNGLMLVMIYLKNKGIVAFDIEANDQVTWPTALVSLVLSAIVFLLIIRQKKMSEKEI